MQHERALALFEKAGVEVPESWTWEEMVTIAKEVQEKAGMMTSPLRSKALRTSIIPAVQDCTMTAWGTCSLTSTRASNWRVKWPVVTCPLSQAWRNSSTTDS